MSFQPPQTQFIALPTSERLRYVNQSGLAAYIFLSLAINSVFFFYIVRVYQKLHYTGLFRGMLPCVLALNLLSAALLVLVFDENRKCQVLIAADAVVSLLVFALFACLRVPPARQLQCFGFVYAALIFGHGAVLVAYAFAGPTSVRAVRAWVFATSLVIYAAIAPWVATASWPSGDEPAYLMLAQSLYTDHDFDLTNNYAHGDYRQFFPTTLPGSEAGYPLAARMHDTITAIGSEHHTVLNQHGEEMLFHDVGEPLLLLPGYALAGRIGAMIELNIISALLALGIFQLAFEISGSQRRGLWSWALFAFTCPLLLYSSALFPEIIGGCLALWAALLSLLFFGTRRRSFLFGAGLLAGGMPWICIRYWMLSGSLLGIVALYILKKHNQRGRMASLADLAVAGTPMVASLALFAWFDAIHFGTLKPNAGYFLIVSEHPQFFRHPEIGFLGLFLDRTYGLLPIAPIYLLTLAGAWVALRRQKWTASLLLVPAGTYIGFMAFSQYWYGGWTPSARYVVAGIAVLPVFASLVIDKRFRLLVLALALWGWAIAFITTAVPLTRWPSLWDARKSGLTDFLRENVKVDVMTIFPSVLRGRAVDYAETIIWLGLIVLSVCWIVVTSRNPTEDNL